MKERKIVKIVKGIKKVATNDWTKAITAYTITVAIAYTVQAAVSSFVFGKFFGKDGE